MQAGGKCFKCTQRDDCPAYLGAMKEFKVINQTELDNLLGKTKTSWLTTNLKEP
ncbi:hypothetical protein JCM19238_4953 [Vibrio ponticus]|nr:hypothetical protein JCM19238_4953 [Vibrio ponticus]